MIRIIFTVRLTRIRNNLSPVASSLYSVMYLFLLLYTRNFGAVLNAEEVPSILMIKIMQGWYFSYIFSLSR